MGWYRNDNNGDVVEVEDGSPSHDNVKSLSNWKSIKKPSEDTLKGSKVLAGPANGSFGQANGREKTANAVVAAATEAPAGTDGADEKPSEA